VVVGLVRARVRNVDPLELDAMRTIKILQDRVAISDLVNSYAQAVDRRDTQAAAELFVSDGELVVGATPDGRPPSSRRGRDSINQALTWIAQYRSTFHEITSHSVEIRGDTASAQTGCEAHHVRGSDETETDWIWFINYFDDFVREPEGWKFSKRQLRIEFVKEHPLKQT
jgi:ketosteroid isomerase-like protein